MGTKTIGVREEVYERLKAHKRADESFSDLMHRLLDAKTTDWRDGFGTLSTTDTDELEALVETSREHMSAGVSTRQQKVLEELADSETDDEAA